MSPDNRLAFCESYAWLRTGMDVGYFPVSEPYSLDERQTWSNAIRKSKSTWSSEFYDLIAGFLTKEYFVIVQDERAQFPAEDSFQAALLAHQSFEHPLIEPLLRELRAPESSVLDGEHKRLDLTQLYEAFDTLPETPTIESLAAGFMRLSETMQMFTDLFPFEEHPAPSYGAEFTLYDAIGALACSRLDLFDKRTAAQLRPSSSTSSFKPSTLNPGDKLRSLPGRSLPRSTTSTCFSADGSSSRAQENSSPIPILPILSPSAPGKASCSTTWTSTSGRSQRNAKSTSRSLCPTLDAAGTLWSDRHPASRNLKEEAETPFADFCEK